MIYLIRVVLFIRVPYLCNELKERNFNMTNELRNVKVYNKSTKETHTTSKRIAEDITKDKSWQLVNPLTTINLN